MKFLILFLTFASPVYAQDYAPPRTVARPLRTPIPVSGAATGKAQVKRVQMKPATPVARPRSGPPLYYRMGGKKVITDLVADFFDRMREDMRIQGFFARTDKSHFKESLFNQFCQLGGGPCRYKGKSMKTSHEGMGVSGSDYTAFVDDLTRSMIKERVPAPEQKEFIAIFASMRKDVVEAP